MEGQGVEDFVSEGDAGQGMFGEGLEIFREEEFCGEGCEALLLGIAEQGQGLDDGVFESLPCFGCVGGDRFQNVGGEFAIVGADLEDAPGSGFAVGFPPLDKAAGEQLPEKRADADAGVEIPVSPDLLGISGIVAEFRLVEGEVQEVGK